MLLHPDRLFTDPTFVCKKTGLCRLKQLINQYLMPLRIPVLRSKPFEDIAFYLLEKERTQFHRNRTAVSQ